MSNTRKHDDLIETFSILDRMHQRSGIDLKAMDAYDVQVIEQLLETGILNGSDVTDVKIICAIFKNGFE